MPRNTLIQCRNGTYAAWDAQSSVILASGEPAFITDFNKLKIGNGSTQWGDLTAVNDNITTMVINKTATTIPKMSVVYINGAQGDLPSITLSLASGEPSSSKTYGITVGAIAPNAVGQVVVDGALKNLDTLTQFNGVAPGTTLWLSPTVSGGITTTKPYAPYHMVAVGNLIRVHQTQGVINVKVQNGYELEELHNVATTGVTDKQYLQYSDATSLWVPTSSGYFSFLTVNDYIDVISSGISNPNFIRFNDTSTPSAPSVGSVSNGTRLLLSSNDSLGHNAIGVDYAGNNNTWFSVPGGMSFKFYDGSQSILNLNNSSLNYNSNFIVDSNGNITTGSWSGTTIAVNKGGTGRTSYGNGQLLIGSGTSLVANTLTAGTGISITNGSGTITINTSGLQTALTNPVTGTGVANHIPYWSSTSGLLADSNQLVWDSTNNRLGIGTSSPAASIDVTGPGRFNAEDAGWTFDSSAQRLGFIKKIGFFPYIVAGSGSPIVFAHSSSSNLGVSVTGQTLTERLYITSIGNVGIGTTSPLAKLHVSSTGNNDSILEYTNSTAGFNSGVVPLKLSLTVGNGAAVGAGVGLDLVTKSHGMEYIGGRIQTNRTDTSNNHALTFWAGGGTTALTEYMRIGSNGNVGIGTASPSEKLEIDGFLKFVNCTTKIGRLDANNVSFATSSSTIGHYGILIDNTATANGKKYRLASWADGTTAKFIIRDDSSGVDRFVIDNAGNVGIGTASPGELLTLYGDSKYLYLQAQNNTGAAGIKFGNTAARQQIYIEGTSNDLVIDSINGGVAESIRVGYNTGAVTINESGSDLDFRVEGDTDANLVFVDASTDRVGIGTATPGYKLQINGSFGATTKSFRIDHPSKKGYSLEYGSLESPYHGVRLTGRGKVSKGVGSVDLPDYLKDLIHDDESVVIQLTNHKHGKTLYVDKIDLQNDRFIVKADRAKSLGELEFFWTLTGTRKDVEDLVVEKEN